MKKVIASLSILAALLVGWWCFPLMHQSPVLQPLDGLVPSPSAGDAETLPNLGGRRQQRRLASSPESEVGQAPDSKPRAEQSHPNSAEEVVRFTASVHGEDGSLPQEGRLSLPGRAPDALSSMDAGGEFLLEVRREQLEPSTLEFRFDALGQASVLFQRNWRGESRQHLGAIQLQTASEVSGRVIDGSGRPVAHALVCAAGMGDEGSERVRRRRELKGPRRGLHSRFTRLMGPKPVALNPETRTDADGHYTLQGIAGSWTKIWARSARSRWCWSKNLAIDPARPVRDVELRLPEVEAKDWITGIVQDPKGTPLAFQKIGLHRPDGYGWNQGESDEFGRFKLGVEDGLARDLSARPQVWEWDVALVKNVVPGTTDVVLQFEESSWLWVQVVNSAGEPVTQGSVMGLVPSEVEGRGRSRLDRVISDLWQDGRARLHVPLVDFDLEVSAEGYQSQRLGPFAQGTSEVIEVVLEKLHGLQVRVTSGGKPVAGALLQVHRVAPEDKQYYPNWQGEGEAFRHDLSASISGSALSDPLGRAVLSLPPKSQAHWRVVAEADGHGAGYSEPVTADDAAAQLELEIALPRPGSLRGRVEFPPGTGGLGWRVMLSDGLALFRESELLEGGLFRFARLHPGAWQVRAFKPGHELLLANYQLDREPREADVLIEAGREALFHFTPPPRPEARLHGQLKIVGHPVGAWQGTLRAGTWDFELDKHGQFEVSGMKPGEWTLSLHSGDPRWSPFRVQETLQLAEGENWWEHELSMGSLSISHPIPQPGESLPTFFARSLGGEAQISVYIAGDPSGQMKPLVLPAAKYRLQPRRWSFGSSSNSASSTEVIVEVLAGQTLEVRLGKP